MRILLAVLAVLSAPSLRALTLEDGVQTAKQAAAGARVIQQRASLARSVRSIFDASSSPEYGREPLDGAWLCFSGYEGVNSREYVRLVRTPDCARAEIIDARVELLQASRPGVRRYRAYRAGAHDGVMLETRDVTLTEVGENLKDEAADAALQTRLEAMLKAFGAASLQEAAKTAAYNQSLQRSLETPLGVTGFASVFDRGSRNGPSVTWATSEAIEVSVGGQPVTVVRLERYYFYLDEKGALERDVHHVINEYRVSTRPPLPGEQAEFERIVGGYLRNKKAIEYRVSWY